MSSVSSARSSQHVGYAACPQPAKHPPELHRVRTPLPAGGDHPDDGSVHRVVRSKDGTVLNLRTWAASKRTPALGSVLMVHGYMEHGGRYAALGRELANAGFSASAIDLRGHGLSAGQRGYVHRFSDYSDDVQAALNVLPEPHYLLGHSNGGLVVLDFVQQRSPKLRGLVVTSPYLALTKPAPAVKNVIGTVAGKIFPRLSLPSGLDPNGLSHDNNIVADYKNDPLVFSHANAAWYRESKQAQARVLQGHAMPVPLLYMFGGADPIASPTVSAQFASQLQGSDITIEERPGDYHEVLNENDRATTHADVKAWFVARAKR